MSLGRAWFRTTVWPCYWRSSRLVCRLLVLSHNQKQLKKGTPECVSLDSPRFEKNISALEGGRILLVVLPFGLLIGEILVFFGGCWCWATTRNNLKREHWNALACTFEFLRIIFWPVLLPLGYLMLNMNLMIRFPMYWLIDVFHPDCFFRPQCLSTLVWWFCFFVSQHLLFVSLWLHNWTNIVFFYRGNSELLMPCSLLFIL
jgi:hypothetical protein